MAIKEKSKIDQYSRSTIENGDEVASQISAELEKKRVDALYLYIWAWFFLIFLLTVIFICGRINSVQSIILFIGVCIPMFIWADQKDIEQIERILAWVEKISGRMK